MKSEKATQILLLAAGLVLKMNKWKFACPLTWLSTYFYEFLCARRADNRNWHLTREFLHFTSCRLDECCKIIYKRNRNNWG